jgi:hypothetical protein
MSNNTSVISLLDGIKFYADRCQQAPIAIEEFVDDFDLESVDTKTPFANAHKATGTAPAITLLDVIEYYADSSKTEEFLTYPEPEFFDYKTFYVNAQKTTTAH